MSSVMMRWLAICCLLLLGAPAFAQEQVIIGIQAYRPTPEAQARWMPLAMALNKSIPQYNFIIKTNSVEELAASVASRQVDFILTNPSQFVLLDHLSGLSAPIASLSNFEHGKPLSSFGGVIFTLASRVDIQKLEDLRNKSIAAASVSSFGGYQMQAYEMHLAGIHVPQDVHILTTQQPQDNVVNAVLTGRADVGFVRTGLLESLADEGKLDIARIKIINPRNLPEFPVQVSTRLYPEWILASLPHTDKRLRRKLASFLLNIEENGTLTQALKINGFDVPQDYSSVENMLRELKLPPFDVKPTITLRDVWEHYRFVMVVSCISLGLLLLLTFRLSVNNKKLFDSESKLQAVLNASEVGVAWAAQDGKIEYVNPKFISMFGYTLNDVPSINQWYQHAFPDTPYRLKIVEEWNSKVARSSPLKTSIEPMEVKVTCSDGSIRIVILMGSWFDTKLLANFSDITELKFAQEGLRIAATAFQSQEGIIVTDADRRILRVNNAFTSITGYSLAEVKGQSPRMLSSGRQSASFYAAMWDSINSTGGWEGEIWNCRKNGEIYPEYLTVTAVRDDNKVVTNYVGSFTDITLRKVAEDKIQNLAYYDTLTQLPNRRLFIDRLNHALAASARSGHQGALLFLDLDHFKTINDTMGHDVGDLLLQQVAERLNVGIREGDTLARIGGDEFILLLEGLSTDATEAAAQIKDFAEKIILMLNQPYLLNEYTYHSTPSIGATLFSGHIHEVEELMKQADIAMYQAKSEGRNTLRFFDPKMQEAIAARADLEGELRKAIELKQFQLYYQVQIGSSGKPLGAEVLIRWLHPERGMISPFNFIPLAEETGLILSIGQWVLDTACVQLKTWQNDLSAHDLVLAVNVSAKQFFQVDFVEQVQATIKRHGINPSRIKLELTESMLVGNINDIITKMNTLSKVGIRFSLDDFGTGYSSLQYLKKLPLDQLKIDQSFVRDIVTNSSDRAIVRTIITMAHSLDINVIAEGVETAEQQQFLLDNGCTHYQGYLFSKPVPIDEFESLIRKG